MSLQEQFVYRSSFSFLDGKIKMMEEESCFVMNELHRISQGGTEWKSFLVALIWKKFTWIMDDIYPFTRKWIQTKKTGTSNFFFLHSFLCTQVRMIQFLCLVAAKEVRGEFSTTINKRWEIPSRPSIRQDPFWVLRMSQIHFLCI